MIVRVRTTFVQSPRGAPAGGSRRTRVIEDTTFGALAALGSAVAWAVTSLLARSLMSELGSVGVNAIRSTIGGALLVVWVLATTGAGAFTTISASGWVLLGLSIITAIALGDTVFFESTRAIGVARAMTVSTTYPLGAAVIAAAFLNEPVTVPIAVGSLVTMAGLVLIVAPWAGRAPEERFWFGIGAAVLASLAWAISTVLVKPPLSEMSPITAQAIRLPVASLVLWLTPWARTVPGAFARSGRTVQIRIAILGVITSVSSVMFVAGVKHAGVAVACVLSSTAPMFAIPLAVVFLGERLTLPAFGGIVLTVAGIILLQL
jgi:drug/metabolite transporter (DMT)-like permease